MTDKPQELRKLDSVRAINKLMIDAEIKVGHREQHIDYIVQEILDWHNKHIAKARLNEVQSAYEYWINGRKFISSYFRDRITELSQTLKEHKEK